MAALDKQEKDRLMACFDQFVKAMAKTGVKIRAIQMDNADGELETIPVMPFKYPTVTNLVRKEINSDFIPDGWTEDKISKSLNLGYEGKDAFLEFTGETYSFPENFDDDYVVDNFEDDVIVPLESKLKAAIAKDLGVEYKPLGRTFSPRRSSPRRSSPRRSSPRRSSPRRSSPVKSRDTEADAKHHVATTVTKLEHFWTDNKTKKHYQELEYVLRELEEEDWFKNITSMYVDSDDIQDTLEEFVRDRYKTITGNKIVDVGTLKSIMHHLSEYLVERWGDRFLEPEEKEEPRTRQHNLVRYVVVKTGYIDNLVEYNNLSDTDIAMAKEDKPLYWNADVDKAEREYLTKALKKYTGIVVFKLAKPKPYKERTFDEYVDDLGEYKYCRHLSRDSIYSSEQDGEFAVIKVDTSAG